MKAIMVMFDSLNRRMLQPYGGDWVQTPNFQRLSQHAATFDNAFIGSMPCMPARRELHTGRYNFLHRSWGPLEPFDDSMPQLLDENGVHSHIVTDHQHYWEDGGATYHQRYTTHEFVRGQEGDAWIGDVAAKIPENAPNPHFRSRFQDQVNRRFITDESMMPQARTFSQGIDFMRHNSAADNWYLQIETFDPHEPFFTQPGWKELYPHEYDGEPMDWPPYAPVSEPPALVEHYRAQYAALLSMCDHYLGRVLDAMDELDLWDDTMLIVNTDHGFLLGEHDWWAKMRMPWYNELANIPLFIWDPRAGVAGEHRNSLVQTIDLPATLLDYFGVAPTADMQGVPLGQTIVDDSPVREAALYGVHGGHINITDGSHVYMRAPKDIDNQPLFNYTLMTTHMRHPFPPSELTNMALADPFTFTKDCQTLKIPCIMHRFWGEELDTFLYDTQADPGQLRPLQDAAVEARMTEALVEAMRASDAPAEQFERLGLS